MLSADQFSSFAGELYSALIFMFKNIQRWLPCVGTLVWNVMTLYVKLRLLVWTCSKTYIVGFPWGCLPHVSVSIACLS